MKTLFFICMTVMAMGMISCGGATATDATETDSTAVDTTATDTVAVDTPNDLEKVRKIVSKRINGQSLFIRLYFARWWILQ